MDLGVLERPCADWRAERGDVIEIRGWIARSGAMTARARLEGAPWQGLHAEVVRCDLPAGPEGPLRGFVGHLRSPAVAAADAGAHQLLEVEVQLDGQPHLGWRRRLVFEASGALARRWLDEHRTAQADAPPLPLTWVIRGDGEAFASTVRSIEASCGPDLPVVSGTPDSHPPVATEWIGFLAAGDAVCESGWKALCQALSRRPAPALVYADHIDPAGVPVLKPASALAFANEPLFWDRGWVVRRETWAQRPAGAGFRPWWAALSASAGHVPLPLCRDGSPRPVGGRERTSPGRGTVSVIIPTRLSDPVMLGRLLQDLEAESRLAQLELEPFVVLNNLRSRSADRPDARWHEPGVRCLTHEGRFNWSAINNAAALQAGGDWLLFLNDDVEVRQPGWLAAMLRTALQPQVGVVGAVLRYADGLVQHAGVWIDQDLRARHSFRHCSGDEPRVRTWLQVDRPQVAVTGACLLTSRRVFSALGGFDESLPVVCNDVDFCLRARVHGQLSVVCAGAELVHHEGLSRGGIAEGADHRRFGQRWGPLLPRVAPERHPLLDGTRDDWQIDPGAAWPGPLRSVT